MSPVNTGAARRAVGRFVLRPWLVAVVAVAVTITTVTVAERARQSAQTHRRAEIELSNIQAADHAVDAVALAAVAESQTEHGRGVTHGILTSGDGARALDDLRRSVAGARQLNIQEGVANKVRLTAARMGAAVKEELRRLERNEGYDSVVKQNQIAVQPTDAAFDHAVDAAATEQESAVDSATTRATTIFVGSLTCGLVLVMLLLLRYSVSRRGVAAEKASYRERQNSERRLASLLENSSDVIVLADADSTLRWVAASMKRVFGHDPAALTGARLTKLMHPNDALVLAEADSIAVVNVGTGSWRLRDGSGDWRHVEISAVDRRDDPAVEGFVVTMRDVDERIALEERLRAQAYHDSLTGLGNRALLAERTEQALAERRDDGNGATVGMLFIDLDDFQAINDGYGHPVGDEVLRLVAKRILQVLGPLEVAARVGGDEFAVLLERVDSVEAAAAAANRIGAVLREPLQSAIGEVVLETSIGVAVARREDATLDTLLRDADAALHVSKADATRVEIYDPARDPNAPERAALAGELRRGIAGHELEVHYQPKVDMGTGHVTAMEALVRWRHPESGLLPPIAFLELAERSGQMAALTHRVLELSLTGLAEVHRQGHDLIVCVNLAAGSLRDPGFVDDVQAMLEHTGVPADRLRLELTEDVLMSDATRAEPTLRALNEMGITFSVDDFGTGHSSLTRLKSMPIDVLKIDRSFVMDMMEDENDSAIVRSTIGLAHDLGLLVVAEGVEDAATWQELRLFGCDTAQGFHIARPLPLAGFTRWIDEWRWTRDRALAGGDGGKRVTAEEAMDLTRTWFGDLFVQSPVAMTLAGLDGRYLRVNRSFCELLRRSEAELLTKTFTDVSHSDGATDSAELRDRLLAGGEPAGSLEKRYVRGDGSLIWVEVNVALVRDAEGRPLLFFSQSQDISARKLAEVQAAQLADVVSATDEAIYSVALDGTMTSWNDGAERLYGYTAVEAVGHSSGMLIPQHPDAFAAGLKQVEGGETLRMETTAIRRDGRPVRVGFSARPLEDESGAIVGASVVAREVQTWQGMFGLDAAGRVTFANPMVTALLGWDPEELIGRPMHELIHHSHADGSHYPLAECPNYACLQDGETRRRSDEVFWRADGTSLPVAYSSTPIVQAGAVTGVVCVFEPYMVGAARHPHGPSGAGRAGS